MRSLNIKALFKLGGCVVEKILVEKIGVQVKMRADARSKPRCPECGTTLSHHRSGMTAVLDLPLADKATVWITLPAMQGRCPECRGFVTSRPPEVHPLRDATWRLMRAVAAWAAACPASTVAAMFAISESTVRRYELDVLRADLPAPSFDGLEVLLVDEKAVRKGHGYVTVVLNGRTGELLHMAEGKKKESLAAFFDKLSPEQRRSIRAVCIDRNGAYRKVLSERLPHADVIHDRFHLVASLNAALDEVRRSEWRKAAAAGKRAIKGCRFLIISGGEKLGEDGKQRLAELTALNAGISAAYILKEDFRAIYATSHGVTEATRKLRRWCSTVLASGIPPLCRFARSLLRELPEATAFFRHRITSGPIEAFNNQIARSHPPFMRYHQSRLPFYQDARSIPPANLTESLKNDAPRLRTKPRGCPEVPQEVAAAPARVDPARLVFIDESGAKTNMTRLRGRARRGHRVNSTAPGGHWRTTTMMSSIRLDGTTACMTIGGATDTEVFRTYVEAVLRPSLKNGGIVIMDNLAPHKNAVTLELIAKAGA